MGHRVIYKCVTRGLQPNPSVTLLSYLSVSVAMVTLQNIKLYIVKGHIADCQLGVEPKLSWQPYTSKVQDALLGGCQATAWPHQRVLQVHAVMLEAALQSLLLPPTSLPSPPSCIITLSTSKVCGFGRPTSTQPSSMTQAGTTPHRTTHSLAFANGLKGYHSNFKQKTHYQEFYI